MSRWPTVLRALRLLVLGETLVVPAGVVAVIAVAVLAREIVPDVWRHAGAAVLPAITLGVLVLATRARRG